MMLSSAGLVIAVTAQTTPNHSQSFLVLCWATSKVAIMATERSSALAGKSQIQETGQRKKIGLSTQIQAAQNPTCGPNVRRPRAWMAMLLAAARRHWMPNMAIADAVVEGPRVLKTAGT